MMGPAPGLAPACRADGWLGRRVAPGRLLTARSPCDMSGSVSPICGYRSRMKGSTAHPAVAAAFSTVEEDTGFTVRGFVVRGDEAAAVLLSDGMIQRTVIIENRTGQWQSPAMISETPWDPSKRPTVTEQPWGVGQASRTQSGSPGQTAFRRPRRGWLSPLSLRRTLSRSS